MSQDNSIADRVRELRQRRGLTQEELAEQAQVSANVVRKIEQGGTARMETYNALARVLGVRTVWFMAAEAPLVDVGHERDPVLADIRSAINPPAGFNGPICPIDDTPPNLGMLGKAVSAVAAAYQVDRYDDMARMCPALVRSAHLHVNALDGTEKTTAVRLRADALQLTGRYLVQIREHDLALIALRDALRDAMNAGDQALAAASIGQQAWALMRQARFDEAEQLCVDTADEIEPRMSKATPDQLSAWGYLLMRAAATAARNNRMAEARELQGMAAAAAAPLRLEQDLEHDMPGHLKFGNVNVAMNAMQNELVTGHPDRALELSDTLPRDGGGVTLNTRQRHALDKAKAHVMMGRSDKATDILGELRRSAPNWLRYQQAARDIAEDILGKAKRMPSQEQRELANFLKVPV